MLILMIMVFQSALPRGERRKALRSTRCLDIFQSALPRGERRSRHSHNAGAGRNFNPRSREGSDLSERDQIKFIGNFNPRSREGSDCYDSGRYGCFDNFNPRSREGSDINFRQKVLFSLSKNCVIHLFFITNFLN